MARQTTKTRSKQKEIEEAAALAAQEAVEDLETENSFETDDDIESTSLNFGAVDLATDVFEEGFKKAMALRDAPRFHIKKNSQFLTVKDYPYSWEQLQKDYGPGYYQVQCKGRSNGRILKSQTEMVGDPNDGRDKREATDDANETAQSVQDNNLAVLGWLQQSQERAEARAREMAKSSESNIATVMQTVMMAQQESTKAMMNIMMESSKQNQSLILAMMQSSQAQKGPDPVITLLTTLLTKEKPKEGMGWTEVMKLMKDAERDAENRTKNMYEMIEKKSEALAEIKAEAMSGGESEEDESLTKTLIKGFVPVLSQMVNANNPALIQQRIEQQRQIDGVQSALNGGFIEDESALRPGISSPQQRATTARQQNVPAQAFFEQPRTQGPANTVPAQDVRTTLPQDFVLDDRHKEMIFNFCAPDIGQAMMSGNPASVTAEQIIQKLEKEGISRQTVANGFKLEDFFGFAKNYIPEDQMAPAQNWLREFYEAIQKIASVGAQSTGTKPIRATVVPANNGSVRPGSNVPQSREVAAKRSEPAPRRTRVQSRDTAKNI